MTTQIHGNAELILSHEQVRGILEAWVRGTMTSENNIRLDNFWLGDTNQYVLDLRINEATATGSGTAEEVADKHGDAWTEEELQQDKIPT